MADDTTREPGREVGIYIDTSELYANGWPKRPSKLLVALVELIAAVEIKPLIPLVCRLEMRQKWLERFKEACDAATDAYEKLQEKHRDLSRYDAPDLLPLRLPDGDEEMRLYGQIEQQRFDSAEYVEIQLPSASLDDLIAQAARHELPFPPADEGFRDGLIALSIAEHAKESNLQAVVVTSDKRLRNKETWQTVLPDVLPLKLDDAGLTRIGELLKGTRISLARLVEIERVEAAREAQRKEHTRMLDALRSKLNARSDDLCNFILAQMRAEPGSVLAIPPDWNLPLDVNFHRRITSVSTDDPLATLTPGVHIAAAVMGMRLRATANIAVPMPGAVARDGRSVPMVPGTSVSHIEGRATVSLRADVADNGSIRDIRFDAVTFEFEKQRSDLQAMYATQRGVVFRDNPTRARN